MPLLRLQRSNSWSRSLSPAARGRAPVRASGLDDRDLARERLAVREGLLALTCGLLAVLCCGQTILRGQRMMPGGLCAALRGARAFCGRLE